MSKFIYAREDSGRELVNGLVLKHGIVYEVAVGDVRYGKGVTSIDAKLCDSLVKEGYLSPVIAQTPAPAPKPSPAAKVEEKAPAGDSPAK